MTGRLRLRDDAFYAPVDDGVHIMTNQGEITLNGGSAHALLERLAPHLDGSRTVGDIVGPLPEERAKPVAAFLELLVRHGVVRRAAEDEPHGLSGDDLSAHAPEIAFVDYFRDSAGAAFERYRGTRVLVVGPPEDAERFLAAAWITGAEGAIVVAEDALGTPEARVTGAGLVVHVASDPSDSRVAGVEAICETEGVPLAQLVLMNGRAWLRPPSPIGPDQRGWLSVRARLRGLAGKDTGTDGTVDEEALELATAQLAQAVFRFLTGTHGARPGTRVREIDLGTLEGEDHTVVPHPFDLPARAETEKETVERVRALEGSPALAEEEFSRRASSLMNARLGVFGTLTEDDFAQLPMHVSTAQVSEPLASSVPRPVVSGAGTSFEAGRYRASLDALSVYGASMVDPRRLLDPEGAPLFPEGTDPWEALDRVRTDPANARVRGVDLTDGRPVLVRSTRVFPALTGADGPVVPLGTAASYDWRGAVAAGLAAHCRERTVEEAAGDGPDFPRVDLDALPPNGLLGYCRVMLKAVGEPVWVHDITGSLGVPVYAGHLAGRTVALGCDLSPQRALESCLSDLLLSWQAQHNGDVGYAPARVPDLPPARRGDAPAELATDPVDLLDAALSLDSGGGVAVVPLDHDRRVHSALPFVLQVVT